MSYVVTAPLVVAKHSSGSNSHIYAGGRLPEDIDEEQLEQLLDSAMVEEVEDEVDEEPAEEPTTVEDILAAVGEDKDLAAEYLEKERAGKNRSTLIEKLEAILTAGN